jgi:hypothetical protein
MKHGKNALPPGPLPDPGQTRTVKHSCGHPRTYTDLPKFAPSSVDAEVETRAARPCRGCRNNAKTKAKAAP